VAVGTPIDLNKLRSLGYLGLGRTRDRVVEGRSHPETGVPFKATTDELGNTTTEHATRDDRVDVHVRAPCVRVTGTVTEERD
jgi:hypothetical protein